MKAQIEDSVNEDRISNLLTELNSSILTKIDETRELITSVGQTEETKDMTHE